MTHGDTGAPGDAIPEMDDLKAFAFFREVEDIAAF